MNYEISHNEKIKLNFTSFVLFFCGASIHITIQLVGEVYLAEIIAPFIAIWLIFTRGDMRVFREYLFIVAIVLGFVSLGGYILSDMLAGTPPSQYIRGWARIAMLIVNCFAFITIATHGKQYIWWILLGSAVGALLKSLSLGMPLTDWKFGYGYPISLLVLLLTGLINLRLAALLIAAIGTYGILMDSRVLGATLIVVSAVIWTKVSSSNEKTNVYSQYFKLLVFGLIGVSIIAATLIVTQSDYEDRRKSSNSGRLAGIVVSIQAVIDSPIVGYGSWTKNAHYAELLREEKASNYDENEQADMMTKELGMGDTFRAHSQILQSWVEGGLFGAAFFLFYGYFLVRTVYWAFLHRSIDIYSPIFTFFLISALWDLVASPFGGATRILIAINFGILTILHLEQKNKNDKKYLIKLNESSLVSEKHTNYVAYSVLQRKQSFMKK